MNDSNLRTLSPNEARENGRKGGIISGQIRKERKALKEQLLMMLESGDIQENICLALIDKAQSGDIKAFEVIRDTIGEKPVDKKEFGADIDFTQLVIRAIDSDTDEKEKNNEF
jgi:hypothetical protein